MNDAALEEALSRLTNRLLSERAAGGQWVGELSGSALSTAAAAVALWAMDARAHRGLIEAGLDWLARKGNADGGWGDTAASPSNISTTLLAWSALSTAGGDGKYAEAIEAAEHWIARRAGGLLPEQIVPAVLHRYGKDRTFSVPILTMCAIAGRLGPTPEAWRWVGALPFELAVLPHQLFKWLRLPVVSYALPALIAIGQVKFHFRPPACPVTRLVRSAARGRTLRVLQDIQPESGGFLEAAPLTAFVTMSLAAMGLREHPVARRGVSFLTGSVRPDGCWPIDTNLATWVTSLAVSALAAGGGLEALGPDGRNRIRDWLLARQNRREHPYTHAAPGGWAWTDLSGGVPDADDTAGALLALKALAGSAPGVDAAVVHAARWGAAWLLDLQNRDGGLPTFCRGWGRLPFDRSSPDLTAHALRAWRAWKPEMPYPVARRIDRAVAAATAHLADVQRPDGAWTPLWFGNQFAPDEVNPTYGTSRVLLALAETNLATAEAPTMAGRGLAWLLSAQGADGGWGGSAGTTPSIEETALAAEALAGLLTLRSWHGSWPGRDRAAGAMRKGLAWLIERTSGGRDTPASPIGLYFAKLWYSEKLYSLIFTAAAFGRARAALGT